MGLTDRSSRSVRRTWTGLPKSSGLATRLHQQLRKLRAIFGQENVDGKVVEKLGETTTAEAKAAEAARLQRLWEEEQLLPLLNWKSFVPKTAGNMP